MSRRSVTYICHRCNDRAQHTHDAVPSDCNAISCTSVRAGQDLWCIRIQRAIIHVEAEIDDARKCDLYKFVSKFVSHYSF